MNQSRRPLEKSDDELIALLERTMNDVARLAPDMVLDGVRHSNQWIATAAAAVIVAGAAGAALVAADRPQPRPISPHSEATSPPPVLPGRSDHHRDSGPGGLLILRDPGDDRPRAVPR
jgi:hypothetical protein